MVNPTHFLAALLAIVLVVVASAVPVSEATVPATDQVEKLQHEMLRLSPLGPFLPRVGLPQLANDDVKDLAREFTQRRSERQNLAPVVIVPSLIGSKLQAQIDGLRSAYWYCWSEWKDWFTVWASFSEFLPLLINCWYEQVTLHLDDRSNRSYNTSGVNVRIVDYGGVDGVTYLDDAHTLGVWNTTVQLLTELGWTVGKNLRAAPYDWRPGPDTFAANDWPRLRSLIEETYSINNNSKVACISLSMGGPYFLAFLGQQSQAWKDKYILSYTSLDGAFGGSPSAISALVSLNGFWSGRFPNPSAMRAVIQSWPSIVWMLPISQIYGDYVWVKTIDPPRNYSTMNFPQMLNDANSVNASKIYRNLQANKWFNFDAPGVECHAFFGTGVPTIMRSIFNTTKFADSTFEYGNGDGVVPEAGLRMLEMWSGKQSKPIYSHPVKGLFHGGSVQNKEVLRQFLYLLHA